MGDNRQQAERILSEKSLDLERYSSVEMQRLIHELQVHQLELEMQNQELRFIQGELEDSNQRYSELYDFAPVGYLTIDYRGLITQVNITYADMVGIERTSLLARSPVHCIMHDDRDTYHVCHQKMLKTITDITTRKRAEDHIKSALEDKNTLLRELYHRTKNNMAVISSMLALQSDQLENEQMRHILQAMEYRIRSMALVHQHLYQTDNLSRIDLHDYIHSLTHLLVESYEVRSGEISLVFDLDNVCVLIDTAIPCGLILNELISNALKHGFPEKRDGEIRIRLHRLTSGEIELLVSDNGVGIPHDIDVRNTETFGLRSLFLLTESQLHGTIECEFNHGFTCLIRFRDTFYVDRI